jgi:hypothetical protein
MECPDECKLERKNLKDNIKDLWDKFDGLSDKYLPRWFGIMIASIIVTIAGGVAYVWSDADNKFVSKDTFSVSESRTREDIKELKQEIRDNSEKVLDAIKDLRR